MRDGTLHWPPVGLILDADLGFVVWLEIFNEVGCEVVPALNSDQALSIVRELELRVDIIVVNPRLWRVAEMIRTLS